MGGYSLVSQYQRYAVKKEMRQRIKATISPNITEQFVFTLVNGQPQAKSFYWEEENEFHYDGKMYDVIEKKIMNGCLYITCINDKREKELINHYIRITKKENNKPGNTSSSAQLILSLVFITPDNDLTAMLPVKTNLAAATYQFRLLNRSNDILIPPPQA